MVLEYKTPIVTSETCPRCKKKVNFFKQTIDIPIKVVRIWFINKTVTVKVNLEYCANCGYLKVTVDF